MPRLRLTLTGLLCCAVSPLCHAVERAQIPLADFFKNARFYSVQISRDGRYVSAITRTEGLPRSRNIVVIEVGKWDEARLVTSYEDEEIRWYDWTDENRLVFIVDRSYENPERSAEYVGLYTVRHDGREGRPLHEPFKRDRRRGLGARARAVGGLGGIRESVALVSDLPNDRAHVLVTRNDSAYFYPDAFRLNLKSGNFERVGDADGRIDRWYADHASQVRVAQDNGDNRDDLVYHLAYRESEADQWQHLIDYEEGDLQLHGFDADNRHFWLSSRLGRDQSALFRLDLESGKLGDPVLSDEIYDIADYGRKTRGLIRDRDGRVLAFEYMADRPRVRPIDDRWRENQEIVDKALPDTFNQISDWSDDHTRLIIRSWSDREPGSYYLLDRGTGKLRHLVAERPWLSSERMSAMNPVSFTARDGMRIHGYLTMPHDDSAGGRCRPDCAVPLIIYPHGGPYGIRDDWGFDQDVQFLASRGYAVLQVNYRGSGGYGWRYERAGYKRWGLEMQDDLTDAVTWSIEQGIADPEQIGIYGASYGGYATMMGLVKTPQLYRLGINYVGVVDLSKLHRRGVTITQKTRVAGLTDWISNWWDDRIGNPRDDKDRFYQTSPINFIDKVDAPVLVIHGEQDYNVEYDYQYRPLVRQLKKHRKEFEVLSKRHEGHGFYREQNRIELYERIEQFLEAHMPADAMTVPTAAEH